MLEAVLKARSLLLGMQQEPGTTPTIRAKTCLLNSLNIMYVLGIHRHVEVNTLPLHLRRTIIVRIRTRFLSTRHRGISDFHHPNSITDMPMGHNTVTWRMVLVCKREEVTK